MYLEFVPQNQELKVDIEEIIKIQPSADTEKSLADKGKSLRGLCSKWGEKITVAFAKELDRIIDLTDKPVVAGNRPTLPDSGAFNSSDPEQVDEYKEKVAEAFALLLSWTDVKEKYADVSVQKLTPENRYMEVTQGINGLLKWVIPERKKIIQMPSGTITLLDDGSYPGHMIAEIQKQDIDRAKYLASLDYKADQAGFKVYVELPVKTKELNVEDGLKSLTKPKLLEVAGKAMVVVTKDMNKDEIIEALLEVNK